MSMMFLHGMQIRVKKVVSKSVWSGHVQKQMATKPMLMLVIVVLQLVRRRQVCFARRQQIRAVLVIVAPTLAEY
jgi:hypothetical protein